MTIEIKQSTAHTFLLGPFVDKDDGVSIETGLATAMDNATTGIRLSKNGGNMADRNDATVPVHDEDGWYTVVLDATDTNTLGLLQIEYTEVATALPAWKDFSVVTANYWDTKYGADVFQADLTQMGGVAQSATDLKDFADDGYDPATNKITGCVLTDAVTILNGLAANVIDAASIAAAAMNGKGDWNIGKTGYSLTQTFPTNFADLSITITTGLVTLAGVVHTGATIPTVTTLTGHTPQTADHTAAIADIPTVAEFNARTILSASYFDPATDTVVTVTNVTNLTNAPTAGDLTATMKTSVNTEVLDVMNTDTITLPGQVAPPLTPTHRQAIAHIYKAYRNKKEQTSAEWRLMADNETTVDHKAAVGDDGTTANKNEIVAGP